MANFLLQAALDYAARGWRVIPLHDVAAGTCSCGKTDCGSPGKHPRTKRGLKDGVADEATVRSWRERWPSANIGVCTGPESGIWMLGPDGPAGIEALAQLERQHGPLPLTPTARSGSGGRHLIFRWPTDGSIKNRKNHLGVPIDARGDGGYFVAAPSRNAKGCYEWVVSPAECEAAEAPRWLLDWVRQDGREQAKAPPKPPSNGRPKGNSSSIEERAIGYLAKMEPAISGQRGHDRLMEAARVLVWGFDLGQEVGCSILSAYFNHRCHPPWSEKELRHKCSEADSVPFSKPRGWLLQNDRNGHHANGRSPPTTEAAPATLSKILLAHLRTTYDPLHRREQQIWSRALGRAVEFREAGQGPPTTLLNQLLGADDCPRDRKGIPSESGLLRLWRQYLGVAWADLLAELPDEPATAELDAAAEEELRRHLAALLGRVVSIGRRVGDGRETEVQSRSLLDCCLAWAVPGMWGRIRSYWMWSRLEGHEPLPSDRNDGQLERRRRLRVALRIDLAGQVGMRPLADWSATRLSRLCEHYGLGSVVRLGHDRARAIELSRDYLEDLLGDPQTDREPGEEG